MKAHRSPAGPPRYTSSPAMSPRHASRLPPSKPRSLERVAGIEPASSAWKAEVLPLNYTRATVSVYSRPQARPHRFLNFPALGMPPPQASCRVESWWWGKDSNLRRLSRQIYSLIPLTTREPHPVSAQEASYCALSINSTTPPRPSCQRTKKSEAMTARFVAT